MPALLQSSPSGDCPIITVAISEKGAILQPRGNVSEDVIVKNSLYKAAKVASKLSFIIELPSVAGVKTRDCHW